MRQRRHRLQVSTFPFLAVLLCAMGSLILLLLVIDRRAKIVARVKAMRAMEQTWAQATAEDEQAAAAHRAEWERRRRLLHEQLRQEDQEVRAELQEMQRKAGDAAAKVETELVSSHQLQEELEGEWSRLAQFEAALSASRVDAAETVRKADSSKADLARLTSDLERMEHTLADLKALRQRQQQMYSLVPYRGKRGDNRRPLYLECTGDDVIFHPDHRALHGWALTPGAIRSEIERRVARQKAETQVAAGKPQENAYLLMLIRPDGIATYYRILAALRGVPLDFGYEFIDQDWILDFSDNDNAPKKQPWMAAEQAMEKQPSSSLTMKKPPLGPTSGRSQSLAGASGWWESSPGAKNPGGQPGRYSGVVGASGRSQGSSTASAWPASRIGEPGIGSPAALANAPTEGNGNGVYVPKHQGEQQDLPSATTGMGRPMGIQATGSGLPDNLLVTTNKGPTDPFATVSPGDPNSSPSPPASLGDRAAVTQGPVPAQADPPFAPGATVDGRGSGSTTPGGQRPTMDQPTTVRAAQNHAPGEAQHAESPGAVGKPGIEAAPTPLPSFTPGRRDGSNSSSIASRAATTPSVGGGSPAAGKADSEEPLHGPPGNPLERFASPNASRNSTRSLPPRPGPLIGNRDWIIPIECTADALVLSSSGQRIATTELSRGNNGNNRLLESVQRMIARRQATVRPGEPPYRPMIRFRVRPEGLRSYYLAYPALEPLQVPMSRENLDPGEKTAAGRQR